MGGYLRALVLLLGLQLFCIVFAGALQDMFQKRAVTCVVLAGLWMSLGVEGFGLPDYTGRLISRDLGQMDGGRDSVKQLRETGKLIAMGF
jgi:hypothetical protein